MEILMDLTNIIIISFILFLLMLTPPFLKRVYHRRQCEKLLKKYVESCKQYNEAISEKPETLPDNVVSLEEYRGRRM
jgi:hypothetical protein